MSSESDNGQNVEANDETGVSDNAVLNQPNPNISRSGQGEIEVAEGVSLADPMFWGQPEERPDPFAYQSGGEGSEGVAPDTITAEGVAGPDSRWWTKEEDESGTEQYVGRDDANYLEDPPPLFDEREASEPEPEEAE